MLTILFATHNGANTLPRMLEALTQVEHPAEWEIIAVDNASTDDSKKILEAFQDRLPLTILHEPRRGKNYALNSGLNVCRGGLVILTDDDVVPHSDWITKLIECADAHPEYDVFGGRILPLWHEEPDPVILNNAPLGVTYAITPDNQEAGAIFPGLVWGPNMMVRRKVFDAGHLFNEKVGPSNGNYIMGSETEFTIRVHDAGHKSWFCDSARVRHIIRKNQMDRNWVIKRAYRFGRQQWHQTSENGFTEPTILGIPRWRYTLLVKEYLSWVFASIRSDQNTRFRSEWEIQFLRGYIIEGIKSKTN